MANPSKPSRTRLYIILSLVVLAAAGGGGYYWKKREKPLIVQTDPVKRRNITETVVATGKIQPVTQVVISPEVPGEIVAMPVKEGQLVHPGDLLLKIKPDSYVSNLESAKASYRSALANINLAKANLEKARLEHVRFQQLADKKLVSDSDYLTAKTSLDVADANYQNSLHQADQLKANVKNREDELAKTTIVSPIEGTVTRLKSEIGERVVGSSMMAGTEVMTIANLQAMEARVDIGEVDIVLIKYGQRAALEIDSFKDRKFHGVVTEISNSAKTAGAASTLSSQEATKFEVRILIEEKDYLRPGMSVTADVETRYRTNVLSIPIQSVTTRYAKDVEKTMNEVSKVQVEDKDKEPERMDGAGRKKGAPVKPGEVVFTVVNEVAKPVKVKRGVSNNNFVEIVEGLNEGQEVVSGPYKAISRDLAEDKKAKVDNSKKIPLAE